MSFVSDESARQAFLCTNCRSAFSRPRDTWDATQKFQYLYGERSIGDIVVAARQSCRVCRLFWETVPVKDLKSLFARGSVSIWLHWDLDNRVFDSLEMDTLQFQLIPTPATHSALCNNLLPSSTASEGSWKFVSECVMKCFTSHDSCRSGQDRSLELPTRLIDIGNYPGEEPRLVISRELNHEAATVQYLTLSHAWSAGTVTKLLKTNIAHFQKRIPLKSLSQTFRDAIDMTRRLSFRYLWIDSLCIVQDCADDWLKESSAMRDIYKGCVYNIAATAASEGCDGLFSQRDSMLISPFIIDIDWKHHQRQYLCFRGAVRYSGFIKAPLNRRGWVIQERLLSPRTIHFSSQLFWECKELEACETYPKGLPEGMNIEDEEESSRFYSFQLQEKSWLNDIKSNPDSKYEVWESIVESFMCCGLTREEDKLVALSGLVKEMQPFMNDEYVAGLWKKDMIKELVWWVEDSKQVDGMDAFRPQVYRAPSWSWASIEGRVAFPALIDPIVPLMMIMDVRITPRTADSTGQILGGWTKVCGRLRPLPSPLPDDTCVDSRASTGIFIDEGKFNYQRPGLFILPVLSHEMASDEEDFIGLILEPTEAASNEFRRVGLLVQSFSDISGMIPGLEWDFSKNDWQFHSCGMSSPLQTLVLI